MWSDGTGGGEVAGASGGVERNTRRAHSQFGRVLGYHHWVRSGRFVGDDKFTMVSVFGTDILCTAWSGGARCDAHVGGHRRQAGAELKLGGVCPLGDPSSHESVHAGPRVHALGNDGENAKRNSLAYGRGFVDGVVSCGAFSGTGTDGVVDADHRMG